MANYISGPSAYQWQNPQYASDCDKSKKETMEDFSLEPHVINTAINHNKEVENIAREILPISEGKREAKNVSDLTSKLAQSLGISDKAHSEIPSNLDQFDLTKEEFQTIKRWYQNNKESLERKGINEHFKVINTGLPRTVIYIAEGPFQGLHIKTKIPKGMGSYNRATKALHVESGDSTIARSGKEIHVRERERIANKNYASIDPERKRFVTGSVVQHIGNWRDRKAMKALVKEKGNPKMVYQEKNVEKVTIIMDDIPGGDLFTLITQNPQLSNYEKLTIFCKLNQALDLAHTNELVNIDLKPKNIFMLDETTPLIGDFGMAFEKGKPLETAMGTPGYFAPEVLNALYSAINIQPATEMWIHGVMMSYILVDSEFLDWTGQTNQETLRKVCDSAELLKAVEKIFPDHDKEGTIHWCIASCLKSNPDDRITAKKLQPYLNNLRIFYTPKHSESEV